MTNYAQHVSRKATPQVEKADPRQEQNNAGGFSFVVTNWERMKRFLVLGSEGGTYYVGERELTKQNAASVEACLKEDGLRAVQLIVEISDSGRAPKNDPAIFALALAASSDKVETRRAALAALPKVCRIGTHLFQFVSQVQQLRGWGRSLQKAVSRWYTEREPEALAYQLIKYQERNGMSHRDVLRLAHVQSQKASPSTAALFRWVVGGREALATERTVKRKARGVDVVYPATSADLPRIIEGFEKARVKDVAKAEIVKLIAEYGLTHEMVPSEHLGHAEVWEALLTKMPLHALVRNLGRMSANGLLVPGSDASREVVRRLKDQAQIKKARMHPLAVLMALRTYERGAGVKGKLTWTAVKPVVDALDDAFYAAFGAIEPSGKSILLALDVSGSMTCGQVAGSPLTPREASACMAMVTARVEPDYDILGFSDRLVPVPITAKMSLTQAISTIEKIPMGGTDCALPMLHATRGKQKVDGFVVYTDSETWHGAVHPHQALRQYRTTMGRPAKLVVVGLTASQFTIADPHDAGMLDVVGFDAAAPAVISDFIGGA